MPKLKVHKPVPPLTNTSSRWYWNIASFLSSEMSGRKLFDTFQCEFLYLVDCELVLKVSDLWCQTVKTYGEIGVDVDT